MSRSSGIHQQFLTAQLGAPKAWSGRREWREVAKRETRGSCLSFPLLSPAQGIGLSEKEASSSLKNDFGLKHQRQFPA